MIPKEIEIISCVVEKLQVNIKFILPNSDNVKHIWIMNTAFRNYFLENYKHLGINETNVDDFFSRTDVKYKIENEDVKKFLFHYLYNVIEELEENESN